MQAVPSASVVVPTRERPGYLEVALGSIAPQVRGARAELLVVSDGPDAATAEVATRHGARLIELPAPRGLNAARNAAAVQARAPLIVFVDDDVLAPSGWLAAYLSGADANPDYDVFGGPIEPRLEGGGPRACGRERAPITNLELGPGDRDAPVVWGANMAIRAAAMDRVGSFDETILGTGDEEQWLRRYLATGGKIRYLARARLQHRRSSADSTLRRLAYAAYVRGRSARRYDERTGRAPAIRSELRTFAGCGWHTLRRRCALGIVFAAQAAGRLRQALAHHSQGETSPRELSARSGEAT